MSSLDDLYQSLPLGQIAQQVGADEQDVAQASAAILPALFGGLQANAQDPAGAASIEEALQQHSPELVDGGIDLSQIDTQDGQKIASHIFGQNEDQVVNTLGGLGGSGLDSPLVKKLIPILAPIVMAYLAKQIFGGTTMGQQQSAGGGMLGSVLGSILGAGAAGGLGGALGGMLGGGAPAQTQAQSMPQMPQMPSSQPMQDPQPQPSGGSAIDSMIEAAINAGQSNGTLGAPQQQSQQGSGGLLGSILGGMLGGGRR